MIIRPIVIAATLLVSGSLLASVTEVETFSYQLDEGGRFSISNVNGSISIISGAGNDVEIIATKKADDRDELEKIEIEISHSNDEIIVDTELGSTKKWFSGSNSSGQVTYEIVVPVNTQLDSVETVNGNVNVSGVAGNVYAETVNGDIDLVDLKGDARLSTVNGGIDASFSSFEGDQSVKAETVNGRVTFELPENADVKISADTLNGSISARDFGLETEKGFVGSDLNGSIGDGSARLNIDTVNGSIKIRKN